MLDYLSTAIVINNVKRDWQLTCQERNGLFSLTARFAEGPVRKTNGASYREAFLEHLGDRFYADNFWSDRISESQWNRLRRVLLDKKRNVPGMEHLAISLATLWAKGDRDRLGSKVTVTKEGAVYRCELTLGRGVTRGFGGVGNSLGHGALANTLHNVTRDGLYKSLYLWGCRIDESYQSQVQQTCDELSALYERYLGEDAFLVGSTLLAGWTNQSRPYTPSVAPCLPS